VACSRLCTEHARTPLNDVEVELQNPILRQEQLESACHDEFADFAGYGATFLEVEVFGQLLGQSAASADPIPVCEVVADGTERGSHVAHIEPRKIRVPAVADLLAQRLPVDAVVLVEAGVFGHQHGTA
jgi:hypothetical protein